MINRRARNEGGQWKGNITKRSIRTGLREKVRSGGKEIGIS